MSNTLIRTWDTVKRMATNLAAVDLKAFFAAQLGTGGIPDALTGPEDAWRRIGVVYRCVRTIIATSAVDMELVNRKGEPVDNKVVRGWLDEPYPGMDYAQWVKRIIGQIAVTGGSRLLQVDEANDNALMPVSLNECMVDGDPREFPPKGFRYLGLLYAPERVISIQGPDPTQINDAISPTEAASLSSDAGYYSRKHAASALKGGAFLGAIMKAAGSFPSKEKRDEFLNGWNEALRRAKQNGTFPLLETGTAQLEIQQLGLTFVDLALPKMIAASDKEIARTFGVPPAYLGEDSNSLANFAEQRKIFLETTLEDTWRTIESAFNLALPKRLKAVDVRFRFDRSQCPIAQEVRQMRGLTMLPAVKRTITANEWREDMGLDLWPPEIGDSIDVASDPWGLSQPFVIPQSKPKVSRAADDIAEGFRAFLAPAKPAALPPPVKREEPPASAPVMVNGRTPNERAIFWRAGDKELAGNERAYAKTFVKIFDGVREELKASAQSQWETAHALDFDRDGFHDLMLIKRKAILPAIWSKGKESGDMEIAATVNPKRSWARVAPMLSEAALYEIFARAEAWTNLTADDTFAALARLIATGTSEGWTLQQMMDQLETFGGLAPSRAERIARTEVLSSLNAGRVDAYVESEVVEQKEWLAVQDDRTRDEHLEADGQTVNLAAPFAVGGEMLDYPGDPNGLPGNIINCRCFVLPVVSKE